jgi:hypothetical protein
MLAVPRGGAIRYMKFTFSDEHSRLDLEPSIISVTAKATAACISSQLVREKEDF